MVGRRTYDQEAVGFIPGPVAIKRLLLQWVTVYGQVNHLGVSPTTQINSAFHPSGVGRSSTDLPGWA